MADLLCNIAQILDVVKGEWGESWSDWDQVQRDGITEFLRRLEQTRVQLAGCSVAALGWAKGEQQAKPGDYGYSASYGDVLKLRRDWEQVRELLRQAQKLIPTGTGILGPLDSTRWHADVRAVLSPSPQGKK